SNSANAVAQTQLASRASDFAYRRSPITEAVLDIQVIVDSSATNETARLVGKAIEGKFPNVQDQFAFSGMMTMGDRVEPHAQQQRIGTMFRSAENDKVLQARINGFSFSKLAPYSSWREFSGEARCLWDIYRATMKPVGITRLAVRYINKIDIALPIADF